MWPFKKTGKNTPPSLGMCTIHKFKDKADTFYPFTFTDIAGMDSEDASMKPDDIITTLKGHINDGYTFNPRQPITEDDPKYIKNPELKDRIHCLVGIIPADTFSMMHEVIEKMKAVREKARIPQAVIMTKVDEACPLVKVNLEKIYTSKKIKQKMEELSNSLGVPVSYIYPVKNYHEERVTNAKLDVLILDALQNIVNFASDYVEDQIDHK
ncbi:Interferon-induced protein 44 [Labeo rohita]|uniref:Interferon-induced protein 44 n=1 Tax=Labeo rohita TaxID=84645 RepID=A0ABQ8M5B5_LABRO|nr:Interferon-induced protein 44 [Labeo rohita]